MTESKTIRTEEGEPVQDDANKEPNEKHAEGPLQFLQGGGHRSHHGGTHNFVDDGL